MIQSSAGVFSKLVGNRSQSPTTDRGYKIKTACFDAWVGAYIDCIPIGPRTTIAAFSSMSLIGGREDGALLKAAQGHK